MTTNAVRARSAKNGRRTVLWDKGDGVPPEDGGESKLVATRLPETMRSYLDGLAKKTGATVTDVLKNAIRLHRAMNTRLAPDRIRLQRYALDEGLDWSTQEAEVYSRLILRGLEDAERRRK